LAFSLLVGEGTRAEGEEFSSRPVKAGGGEDFFADALDSFGLGRAKAKDKAGCIFSAGNGCAGGLRGMESFEKTEMV